MAAAPHTLAQAFVLCGLTAVEAARISADKFDDNFESCMDKGYDKLDDMFISFGELTAAKGRVRFTPRTKQNVKALIQWVKDQIRTGRNPDETPFPVNDFVALLRRHKTHKSFVAKSKMMTDTADPKK